MLPTYSFHGAHHGIALDWQGLLATLLYGMVYEVCIDVRKFPAMQFQSVLGLRAFSNGPG